MGGEEICVLKAQMVIDRAVENHVGLVLNSGGGSTHQAGALMAWGLDGLGQVAFTFNTKVMAARSEAREGCAVFAVGNFQQMRGRKVKGEIAANMFDIVSKLSGVVVLAWGERSGGRCYCDVLAHQGFAEPRGRCVQGASPNLRRRCGSHPPICCSSLCCGIGLPPLLLALIQLSALRRIECGELW